MVGITGFGTYIPRYRLPGEVYGKVWGKKGSGERAVANYDEDAVTMAVAALQECIDARNEGCSAAVQGRGSTAVRSAQSVSSSTVGIDGLYFASTTAPYAEKSNAAIVAMAADLSRDIFTADFAGSLRGCTAALGAAFDAVRGGSAREVAVAAADCRRAVPGSNEESTLGDAAAALLVGGDSVLAELVESYRVTENFLDVWRTSDKEYIQSGDARFIQLYGYEKYTLEAVRGLLDKCGLQPEDIDKAIFYAPDRRIYRGLCKKLNFPASAYLDDTLYTTVGNTGTSLSFLRLAEALEKAGPGELIILIGYGDGADAFLFKTTGLIDKVRPRLDEQIKNKRMLENYGKYLQFRNLVYRDEVKPFSSEIIAWREQNTNLRLHAQKCTSCGAVQFPARRVCLNCSTKDSFKEIKFSRRGRIYTYTKDYLFISPDPPVIMASVDMDGGGRFYSQVTDCDPDDVEIGMEVEVTFRKYHEGAGFNNYFWKFRPASKFKFESGKEGL